MEAVGQQGHRAVGVPREAGLMWLPILLIAVVAVGCGGHRAPGPELPVARAEAEADPVPVPAVVAPGEQRVPDATPRPVTVQRHVPVGRASLPRRFASRPADRVGKAPTGSVTPTPAARVTTATVESPGSQSGQDSAVVTGAEPTPEPAVP